MAVIRSHLNESETTDKSHLNCLCGLLPEGPLVSNRSRTFGAQQPDINSDKITLPQAPRACHRHWGGGVYGEHGGAQ